MKDNIDEFDYLNVLTSVMTKGTINKKRQDICNLLPLVHIQDIFLNPYTSIKRKNLGET